MRVRVTTIEVAALREREGFEPGEIGSLCADTL